ncbi:MAG: ABC transporter substrate-binding protein [Acidimicrobiales bacterium]
MRDNVVVIFMVGSLIATLVLGGAVAYELGRDHQPKVSIVPGGVGGGQAAITPGGAVTADTTPGQTQTSGTTPVGGAASQGQSSASAATPAQASQSGAASNQAVTGGVIRVGGLFDETGPVDATVERDTVRAYFNDVNAGGGVNGKTIVMVDCDSKFNTTDGANCANKLVNNDHVFAEVGETAPNGEDATAHTFTAAGIPIIGGLGTPNEVNDPLSFPVGPAFTTYGVGMGNRAADLKFTDVGIVVVNISFIQPVVNALKATLSSRGVKVVATELVDATKANYADTVLDLQSHGAKSIVAALDPFSYERLFQSMQGASFKPPFLGLGLDKGSANPSPANPNNGYGQFVKDMWSITPFLEPADHPNDPAIQTYISTVRKYFPNQVAPLDVYTEGAWTAAHLFVDALRRAGPNPSQKGLVDALNATKNFMGGGLQSKGLSYSAGPHDPNRCFWMLQNQNLVWTTVTQPKCF